MEAQFSILGEANRTMKLAADAELTEKKNSTQTVEENNPLINAVNYSKEESQAAQQRFYISIGN